MIDTIKEFIVTHKDSVFSVALVLAYAIGKFVGRWKSENYDD